MKLEHLPERYKILVRLETLTDKELDEYCKKFGLKILTNRQSMWAGLHKARIECFKYYKEITLDMFIKSSEWCKNNGFSPFMYGGQQ